MNKHYENAVKIIGDGSDQLEGAPAPDAMMVTIDANTHATLALAYEQRTANLIAVFDADPLGDKGQLATEIRERLGLK